jgi:hypothetical protein
VGEVEKSRASVSTILHVPNYGSVFQAYATQVILESFGIDVEFVDYIRPDLQDPVRWAAQRSQAAKGPVLEWAYRQAIGGFMRRRSTVFEEFIHRRLRLSRRYSSIEELLSDPPDADVYITGSDQVWNRDYNAGGTAPFLLEFAPQKRPRIAMAASVGKELLSPDDVKELEPALKKYQWISVRETDARDSLAKMAIESDLLLDPTLMLTGAQWKDMAKGPHSLDEYVLVYCLNPRGSFSDDIAELVRQLSLPVVVIQTVPFLSIVRGAEYVLPTPEEFLGLLSGAKHVVTDSFHGTAFCLNLDVPVSVVLPKRYSGRIKSLLDMVDFADVVLGDAAKQPDWTPDRRAKTQLRLAHRRDHDIRLLRDVLEDVIQSGGSK